MRILIMDNNRARAEELHCTFINLGYHSEAPDSAEECLRVAVHEKPHLVLAFDFNSGASQDALDISIRIKALCKQAQFIVLSEAPLNNIAGVFRKLHPLMYFQLPMDLVDLVEYVEGLSLGFPDDRTSWCPGAVLDPTLSLDTLNGQFSSGHARARNLLSMAHRLFSRSGMRPRSERRLSSPQVGHD